MVIVPPIAAFVAAGFEHSIANIFLLPYGLAIKAWAGAEFWAAISQNAANYPTLTIGNTVHNIVVSTIGNLVGGSLMVGAVYWFIHLRRRPGASNVVTPALADSGRSMTAQTLGGRSKAVQ